MFGSKTQADIERENQINAGRNLSSTDGREIEIPMVTKRRITIDNKKPSATNGYADQAKAGFQAKGHDAVLKAAQDRKATVMLTLTTGALVVGHIIARDRYTISIKPKDHPDTVIVYKHFIGMFQTVKGEE